MKNQTIHWLSAKPERKQPLQFPTSMMGCEKKSEEEARHGVQRGWNREGVLEAIKG